MAHPSLPVQCSTDTSHWHLSGEGALVARKTAVALATDTGQATSKVIVRGSTNSTSGKLDWYHPDPTDFLICRSHTTYKLLLRQDRSLKVGIANQRLAVVWDKNYLC